MAKLRPSLQQKCGRWCPLLFAGGGQCWCAPAVTFWEPQEAVLSAGQGSLPPKSAKAVFVSVLTHPTRRHLPDSRTLCYGEFSLKKKGSFFSGHTPPPWCIQSTSYATGPCLGGAIRAGADCGESLERDPQLIKELHVEAVDVDPHSSSNRAASSCRSTKFSMDLLYHCKEQNSD